MLIMLCFVFLFSGPAFFASDPVPGENGFERDLAESLSKLSMKSSGSSGYKSDARFIFERLWENYPDRANEIIEALSFERQGGAQWTRSSIATARLLFEGFLQDKQDKYIDEASRLFDSLRGTLSCYKPPSDEQKRSVSTFLDKAGVFLKEEPGIVPSRLSKDAHCEALQLLQQLYSLDVNDDVTLDLYDKKDHILRCLQGIFRPGVGFANNRSFNGVYYDRASSARLDLEQKYKPLLTKNFLETQEKYKALIKKALDYVITNKALPDERIFAEDDGKLPFKDLAGNDNPVSRIYYGVKIICEPSYKSAVYGPSARADAFTKLQSFVLHMPELDGYLNKFPKWLFYPEGPDREAAEVAEAKAKQSQKELIQTSPLPSAGASTPFAGSSAGSSHLGFIPSVVPQPSGTPPLIKNDTSVTSPVIATAVMSPKEPSNVVAPNSAVDTESSKKGKASKASINKYHVGSYGLGGAAVVGALGALYTIGQLLQKSKGLSWQERQALEKKQMAAKKRLLWLVPVLLATGGLAYGAHRKAQGTI